MGVVPLLIFLDEASIPGSGARISQPVAVERDRDDASLASFAKFGFQFQVHLDQIFTKEGGW